ncbi:hypothetical protein [Lonepinella sp. BR2357]|uniref:hypothetical protein n=1 Tax=Lonepinella sp. BR2357 TaxID=3434549 RepID=UPI003F6DBCAD
MKKLILTAALAALFCVNNAFAETDAQKLQRVEKAIQNGTSSTSYLKDLNALAKKGNVDATIYVGNFGMILSKFSSIYMAEVYLRALLEDKQSCKTNPKGKDCQSWKEMRAVIEKH